MTKLRFARLTLLAAALSLAACAHSDVGITTMVKAKMEVDKTVRDAKIEVTTKDRVVTLTGNIDSEAAKQKAIALAKETKGVVEVRDMIAVKRETGDGDAPDPGRTIGVTIDDADTTVRVKSRLLEDPLVQGLKIDVDTRDGVVFLTGTVGSDPEKQQAIKLARETKGVKDVQANLTVGKS
jgi:osmotically-inducible protein OsmY